MRGLAERGDDIAGYCNSPQGAALTIPRLDASLRSHQEMKVGATDVGGAVSCFTSVGKAFGGNMSSNNQAAVPGKTARGGVLATRPLSY